MTNVRFNELDIWFLQGNLNLDYFHQEKFKNRQHNTKYIHFI